MCVLAHVFGNFMLALSCLGKIQRAISHCVILTVVEEAVLPFCELLSPFFIRLALISVKSWTDWEKASNEAAKTARRVSKRLTPHFHLWKVSTRHMKCLVHRTVGLS